MTNVVTLMEDVKKIKPVDILTFFYFIFFAIL